LADRFKGAWKAAAREMLGPWPATELPTGSDMPGSDLTRLVLDWVVSCMSPADEVRGSAKKLRLRARELERNNAYVTSYENLLTANVLGPIGITLQAKVRNNDGELAKIINRKIEEAWRVWSEGPVTLDGKQNLRDYSEVALETVARDGESFTHFWEGDEYRHGIALEGIDADLVDEEYNRSNREGNRIDMGIESDLRGRVVQYHVKKDYPSLFSAGAAPRYEIPASEMIHMFRPKRVKQPRGITWLGPTMIALRMLEGYEEAELIAARIAAAKMGFFQSQRADVTSEFSNKTADAKAAIRMEANPGTMEQLPIGWEFKEWDPQHPNTAFPAFVKGVLRKVATGLGVSYNALASDLEGVNYSSMRSGLLMERETWRVLQQWWIGQFQARIYRRWLASTITRGILVLDAREFERFYMVKWNPRGWQAVDPKKDAEAAVIEIRAGLTSRQRILAERGIDFEDVVEELAEEQELADELEVEIGGDPPAAAAAAADSETTDTGDDENGNGNGDGRGRDAVLAAMRLERFGRSG
jgi:lambda family phage portal protein